MIIKETNKWIVRLYVNPYICNGVYSNNWLKCFSVFLPFRALFSLKSVVDFISSYPVVVLIGPTNWKTVYSIVGNQLHFSLLFVIWILSMWHMSSDLDVVLEQNFSYLLISSLEGDCHPLKQRAIPVSGNCLVPSNHSVRLGPSAWDGGLNIDGTHRVVYCILGLSPGCYNDDLLYALSAV